VYVSAALPFLSAYARLVALNVVAQRVVYFNLTPHKRFWLAVLRVAENSGSFIQAFSLARIGLFTGFSPSLCIAIRLLDVLLI
jgi:hypothetical protein